MKPVTLTITLDGGATREFSMRTVLNLRMRSVRRRAHTRFCEARHLGLGEEVDGGELFDWILEQSDLVNEMMRAAWDGDHDGIDWYAHADGEEVAKALLGFFVSTTASSRQTTGGSTSSSAPTPTSSTETESPTTTSTTTTSAPPA